MSHSPSDAADSESSLTAEERSMSSLQGAQAKAGESHPHKHHHHHHHRHIAHSSRHNHCGTSQRSPDPEARPSHQEAGSLEDSEMSVEGPRQESAAVMHPLTLAEDDPTGSVATGQDQHNLGRHQRRVAHHSQGLGSEEGPAEILPSGSSTDVPSVPGAHATEAATGPSRSEQQIGNESTPPAHQHFHRHPGHHHQHAHRRQLNLSHDEAQDDPSPRDRHRLLQDQQRQQHFRTNPFNSGLWISIELGFLLTQIVAAIVILPLSIYEQPKDPLGVWVTGYAAGCAALLPLLYWRYSQWCARDVSGSSGTGPAPQGESPSPVDPEGGPGASQQDSVGDALLEMHQPRSTSAGGAAAAVAGLDADIEAGLRSRRRRAAARRVLCFDMDDPRLPLLIAKYKAALDCFFAMWYVLGSMWVLGGTTTFQDAPMLYSVSLVYIVLSSISYGVPFLLCATICCCLPCIIAVMGSEDIDPARPQGTGLGPGNSKGAAPEAIAALPTFVFRTSGGRRKDEKQGEGGEEDGEGVDLESGLSKADQVEDSGVGKGKLGPVSVSVEGSDPQPRAPASGGGLLGAFTRAKWLQGFTGRRVRGQAAAEQERIGRKGVDGADSDDDADSVGSGEEGLLCAGSVEEERLAGGDAVCCICLAHYRDGAELRRLPCHHHFHASCVDTWLVINGCCPLCKEPIAPSAAKEPEPES